MKNNRGPMGRTHPMLGKPTQLPFGSLKVSVERFQVRNADACSFVKGMMKRQDSVELATSLMEVLEQGNVLDPVIYWTDADGTPWVIDGHHRMEAYEEVSTPSTMKVWGQRYMGVSEGEARDFALEINRRFSINMDKSESLDAYWRMYLCNEVSGSVRERAKYYAISPSTVSRMAKEKPAVLEKLRIQAFAVGVVCDVAYIRGNAPAWHKLATWRDASDVVTDTDYDRRTVEIILRSMTKRFVKQARTQPDLLVEAFCEFIEEVMGRELQIYFKLVETDEEAAIGVELGF